jgi:hypothetical protein
VDPIGAAEQTSITGGTTWVSIGSGGWIVTGVPIGEDSEMISAARAFGAEFIAAMAAK